MKGVGTVIWNFIAPYMNETRTQKLGSAIAVLVPILGAIGYYSLQARAVLCEVVPLLGYVVDCAPIVLP